MSDNNQTTKASIALCVDNSPLHSHAITLDLTLEEAWVTMNALNAFRDDINERFPGNEMLAHEAKLAQNIYCKITGG